MKTDLFAISASEPVRLELEGLGARLSTEDEADWILSADPKTRPSAAASIWSKRGDADLVVAARRSKRSLNDRFYRRLLNLPYYDYSSGVRLYSASAVRRTGADPARPLEALVKFHRQGFRIREVPVDERPNGPSPGPFTALRLRALRSSANTADADELWFNRRWSLRARRLKTRLQHTVSFLEVDVPLLDVGCGSGRLIQSIAHGVAVDIDVNKLRYLRGRSHATGVLGTLGDLPFGDGSFRQVVCTGVLDKLSGEPTGIGELKRILRPGGTLVIGGPGEATLRQKLEEVGFRIDDVRRVAGAEVVIRAIRG